MRLVESTSTYFSPPPSPDRTQRERNADHRLIVSFEVLCGLDGFSARLVSWCQIDQWRLDADLQTGVELLPAKSFEPGGSLEWLRL